MSRRRGKRLRQLRDELKRAYPEVGDPDEKIASGLVTVDGCPVFNPRSMVRGGARIELVEPRRLRGEVKLEAALDSFGVDVRGRIALDVGASAGGFTKALLLRGAKRVYAVDAGHGQLLGWLRQDPRVVNLESTNVASLDTGLVPDEIELFTLDFSYLSLAEAVPQLEAVQIAEAAELVALVKPQFELRLSEPPVDARTREEALSAAREAIRRARWSVDAWIESPVRGSGGALEYFIYARRRS